MYRTYFVWIVEDVTAQVSVQELIEVGHQALSFHSPLPRCVHPLQLITEMANLGCHVANMLIKLLEMLKGHLQKRALVITVSLYCTAYFNTAFSYQPNTTMGVQTYSAHFELLIQH